MTKAAKFVENCGFQVLDTKHKLQILRKLLEAQLEDDSGNQRCKRFLANANAERLRNEPLGRDRNGNWYWKFSDGNSIFVILKELANEKDEPFFEYIRSEKQIHSLMARLHKASVKRYCGGGQCKHEKYAKGLMACFVCKTKWHPACLVDCDLHYNQSEWQCPKCEEEDLLENLRGLLREE